VYSAFNTDPCVATLLIDIVGRYMHASRSEWLFFRELRVGTSRGTATYSASTPSR
jgi:hypothetical protein